MVLAASPAALGGHDALACADCHVASPTANAIDPDAPMRGEYGGPTDFTLYGSRTLDAELSQPNGNTRLCLGCHDGTYVASAQQGHEIVAFGSEGLASSHPVSFVYDSALAMRDGHLLDPSVAPAGVLSGGTVAERLLDPQGRMQCSTCHDPHANASNPGLLRWENDGRPETMTAICRTCHIR